MFRRFFSVIVVTLVSLVVVTGGQQARAQDHRIAMAIHGGAGNITRDNMTPEREQQYKDKLTEALRAGYDVLQQGRSSLDAVVAAIQVMEDSPLFNAGKGAVFTNAETNELDASIMYGKDRNAGAVAGVKDVKSPIALARLVMERSPHVMLSGAGASAFAKEQGVELVPPEYFRTERRLEQLRRLKEREGQTGYAGPMNEAGYSEPLDSQYGTVGAVALDKEGNLSAGTSTGGMTNKRWGRIGDSPIIGAGTYADNETCAISATGHGEYFIRGVVAYDVAAMMRYAGLSLPEAANAVIHGRLTQMGGTGGIIAMDHDGNVVTPFNTPGMFRGQIDNDGNVTIAFYRD